MEEILDLYKGEINEMGKSIKSIIAMILSLAISVGYVPVVYSEETTPPETSANETTTTDTTIETTETVETTVSTETSETTTSTEPEKKNYNLRINKSGEGYVYINGEEISEKAVNPADVIEIKIKEKDENDIHYRFDSLTINNENIEIIPNENGEYVCQYTIPENPENNDINININFIQVYKVSLIYDANKGAVYNSTDENAPVNGDIEILQDTDLTLIAKPFENYYVKQIKIDEQLYDINAKNTDKSGNVTINNLDKDSDHTIEVEFEMITYSISADENTQNGTITIENNSTEIGGSGKIKVVANEGYYISKISVNSVEVDPEAIVENENFVISDYNCDEGTFEISRIKENITVSAEFTEVKALTLNDIEVSSETGNLINRSENRYFFKQNSLVSIKTDTIKDEIILKNENAEIIAESRNSDSAEINSAQKISYIIIKYRDSKYNPSIDHTIDCSANPIEIVYNGQHTITLEPDFLEESLTAYSKSVNVKWNIELPQGLSVSQVLYWIDGESEEDAKELEVEDIKSNKSIIVDSEKYNRANIKLHVKIIDSSGQESYAETKMFSINSTKPEIGEISKEDIAQGAEQGYYNTDRIVTIIINDRSDTFNKNVNAFTITKNGEELSAEKKSEIITWEEKENQLIAKMKFKDNGHYTWSLKYTNLAGLYTETLPGDNFHIVKINESIKKKCKIEACNTTWEEILNTVTFGIFRKSEIKVIARPSDELQVKEIAYYKKLYTDNLGATSINTDTSKIKQELDALYKNNEFEVAEYIKVNPNEKAVVYARIMDIAGNVIYVGTDGLIADNVAPKKVEIERITEKTGDADNVFNSNVEFSVAVDESTNEVYSGLKKVIYQVWGENNRLLHSEPIFEWEAGSNLCTNYERIVSIDASNPIYNQDNMYVKIIAIDNADNANEICSDKFTINTDQMTANITFDNNNSANGIYFKEKRTAYITITTNGSRKEVFNEEKATKAINDAILVNSSEENSEDEPYTISEWKHDGDKHTAEIHFESNGTYKISNFHYTNEAGNSVDGLSADNNQVAPYEFVIDTKNPIGSVTLEKRTWDVLLKTLTFGLFNKDGYEVTAKAEDVTSPYCFIQYYITDNVNPMSSTDLDKIDESQWKAYDEKNKLYISEENHYVVYLRIIDCAGNYIYVCSDGHVIDRTPPEIKMTFDEPVASLKNGNESINIYNKDVKVKVDALDIKPYSGIKYIKYWVTKDGVITQEDYLFTFTSSEPAYSDLEQIIQREFTVLAEKNNSSDVAVWVEVCDNADNKTIVSKNIDIDITAPEISVSYDNNTDNNGNTYFKAPRTATISIKERTSHFETSIANQGIIITAVDVNGNSVGNVPISNWTTTEGKNPDDAIHTAKISYSADANYTFRISYMDKAKNSNKGVNTGNSVAPYKFTVDTTAPTGNLYAVSSEGRLEQWNMLLDTIDFGFWSRDNINITGNCEDKTSPIETFAYYKTTNPNVLSANELNQITGWSDFGGLNISPNEQATVYLKIVDKAGNITYINTNGMIVDNINPRSEIDAPIINITPQQTSSGIYNSDVTINITVEDPLVGETYSGLNNITYRVLNMGNETQSGTFYSFDKVAPQQNELLRVWSGQIVVSSQQNNSNDVLVEVRATDNAGNSSVEYITIKIDITAPTVDVTYSDDKVKGSADKYYHSRTANIVITERNFDSNDAIVYVTKDNITTPMSLNWTAFNGGGNGDNTQYFATLPFASDGNYTFSVSFTDMAGNKSNEVKGEQFIIDVTPPAINVNFDNNNVSNDTYFKNARTATISINERNFNKDMAQITMTGNIEGQAVKIPTDIVWKDNGNVHMAIVSFKQDGDYTFKVECTDMAGNKNSDVNTGNSVAVNKFTIDNVNPELEVTVNDSPDNKAYSGKVIPKVKYSDINYDAKKVFVSMTGVNVEVTDTKITDTGITFTLKNPSGEKLEWKGKFTNEYDEGKNIKGKMLVMDNFPSGEKLKGFDDIYTLQVSITDKANRNSTQSITFSVNRFGSTYDISSVKDLIGNYITTPRDIKIVEVNPNKLSDIKVVLFKNNDTVTLKKDTDYSVDIQGDEGTWYKYTYTISQSNFEDDGVYTITLHSKDAANNIAENTLDTKNSEISFGIDNTNPTIVVANLESGKTYAEENKSVTFMADDNLKLDTVDVYLDSDTEIYKNWNSEEIEKLFSENDEFTFDISDNSNYAHKVKIVCVDAAGNKTEQKISNFYVTTNILVRYYNNKGLFFGSIFGVLLIVALVLFSVMKKRKNTLNQH